MQRDGLEGWARLFLWPDTPHLLNQMAAGGSPGWGSLKAWGSGKGPLLLLRGVTAPIISLDFRQKWHLTLSTTGFLHITKWKSSKVNQMPTDLFPFSSAGSNISHSYSWSSYIENDSPNIRAISLSCSPSSVMQPGSHSRAWTISCFYAWCLLFQYSYSWNTGKIKLHIQEDSLLQQGCLQQFHEALRKDGPSAVPIW